MDALHIGYLAGLIDGEGTFTLNKGSVAVRVASTDLDIVERALQYSGGLGHINGPYRYGSNQKEYWLWAVSSQEELTTLMDAVYPHMSQRRKDSIDQLRLQISRSIANRSRACVTCDRSYVLQKRARGKYCSKDCWKIGYYSKEKKVL